MGEAPSLTSSVCANSLPSAHLDVPHHYAAYFLLGHNRHQLHGNAPPRTFQPRHDDMVSSSEPDGRPVYAIGWGIGEGVGEESESFFRPRNHVSAAWESRAGHPGLIGPRRVIIFLDTGPSPPTQATDDARPAGRRDADAPVLDPARREPLRDPSSLGAYSQAGPGGVAWHADGHLPDDRSQAPTSCLAACSTSSCFEPVKVGRVIEIRGREVHRARAMVVIALYGTPPARPPGPGWTG